MLDRDDARALAKCWGVWAAAILLALAVFSKCSAAADLDGRYANSPDRDWYQRAELTEAAAKRFGFKSCCAHSDVVRTRFRPALASDGWDYLDGTRWRQVPPDIIHHDKFAPNGEPVMFAVGGRPTCFFPPAGGL